MIASPKFGLLTIWQHIATRKDLFLYPQGDGSGLRNQKKDKRQHLSQISLLIKANHTNTCKVSPPASSESKGINRPLFLLNSLENHNIQKEKIFISLLKPTRHQEVKFGNNPLSAITRGPLMDTSFVDLIS